MSKTWDSPKISEMFGSGDSVKIIDNFYKYLFFVPLFNHMYLLYIIIENRIYREELKESLGMNFF